MNFILTSEPRNLWYYDDAYKLKQRSIDNEEWKLGMYFANAISATVGNMFSKGKRHKYAEKPFLNDILMTDAERKKQAEAFFMGLQVMQANFELSKQESEVS